jgi:hypothetical protein
MKIDDRQAKAAPAPASEAEAPRVRRPLWSFADLKRTPRLGAHRSIHGAD